MWFYVGADGAPQAGIWDCMMQEGIKVLFRVILGLFKTYQDEILRCGVRGSHMQGRRHVRICLRFF